MRLTEFIQQHRGQILKEWVRFAASLLPWAKGIDEKGLQDHAEELLSAVVSDMELPQSKSEKSDKSKGHAARGALGKVGQKHASERLETGFNLDQLVSEYRALRASVLKLWEGAQGDKQGEVTRFNEAIDETLAESASRYSQMVNTTREQFLGILGHDLRSPLASIVLGATQLTKPGSLDGPQAQVAARILSSAQRMSRMVDVLLDLTRTRLGSGIPVTPERMDLTTVCQQVISELEGAHPGGRIRFEAEGDLHGEWDSDRIAQVISNLVGNALQYGAKGTVSVVARAQGEEIMLQVHNEGPPIPERAMKTLFEPMVRHRPATPHGDHNATGLGLGLYIAHEVVTAHGGTLGVTSTQKEGTTFTMRIPRHPGSKQEHTRPDAAPAEQQEHPTVH